METATQTNEPKGLTAFFEWKKRDNGESFVSMKDVGNPEWLRDAIRDAHRGDLPNDWIFAECYAACEAIDEGVISDDDDLHEYVDGRVDIYTRELFDWAASLCLSTTFSEAEGEAEELGGGSERGNVAAILGQIQFCAIRYIAEIVLHAVHQNRKGGE